MWFNAPRPVTPCPWAGFHDREHFYMAEHRKVFAIMGSRASAREPGCDTANENDDKSLEWSQKYPPIATRRKLG